MIAKLREAIQAKDVPTIREITNSLPTADLADVIEGLSPQLIVLFFLLLKTETQSKIFSHLEPKYQEQLIRSFTDEQIDQIVGDLYAHEIADLFEEVPAELQTRVLQSIHDRETRDKVNKLLKYDDDHIGSVMNVDFVLLSENQTLSQGLKIIRASKNEARLAHYFFVADANKKLTGYVALEDLVFGNPRNRIKKVMKASPFVVTNETKEAAAQSFAKHDMSVLPVVTPANEMIGFIASDDMIDVINQIATEDAQKAAGITTPVASYTHTTIARLFKSRVLWLLLLMISATLSQIVLDAFQKLSDQSFGLHGSTLGEAITINLTSAIVAILPVISGAAGNAGSQSSTTIIRALATGDISTKDYLRVFRKELGTSSMIGLALCLANFSRLLIYYAAEGSFNTTLVVLSAAASVSLLIVIVLAQVTGGLLPLLGKRIKLDPAVMAAPLLTTLIDALSTLIFFGISIGVMLAYL